MWKINSTSGFANMNILKFPPKTIGNQISCDPALVASQHGQEYASVEMFKSDTVVRYIVVLLHVRSVITSCAQTLHALRVLRAYGLCESALRTVFRAVV